LENLAYSVPTNYLVGVDNFTVFVRVSVKSPKYNREFDNANGTTTTLNYNLFRIGDLVTFTSNEYDQMKQEGGAIAIMIYWDCNLDQSGGCQPKYSFLRVDANNSGGYNFRYASYYYMPQNVGSENYTEFRDLLKVYGLRFVFLVTGRAGRFNIIPLVINIGSGLALLGVATIICDFFTLYLIPGKKFYNKVKYEQVEVPAKNIVEEEELDKEAQLPGEFIKEERTPLLDTMKFK